MEDKKLICPVKRLNKTNMDLNINLQDDSMNVKLEVNTKNIIKSVVDFINKKYGKKED